jgi:acetyl-CoA C-acetyltransferase
MLAQDIVIVGALRTPVGKFLGGLSSLHAHQLGAKVISELVTRLKVNKDDVSEIIMGQVLTGGHGQNPARQASVLAGLPHAVPACTINQVCGSGLRAVAMGWQSLMSGDSRLVICGGQEAMSQSMHASYLRQGSKMGDLGMVDMMVNDGLTDAFHRYHMGITAENVAKEYKITREEQDQFSVASHHKAAAAMQAGVFNSEIMPVVIEGRKETITIAEDEGVRADSSLEALAKLRPAFTQDGTVTAGNASSLNDGAAAVALMRRADAEALGLPILAKIAGWAHAGVAPEIMGTGPIHAVRALMKKIGWTLDQLDLIEANEAFAAQAIAVNRELGWDTSKVNVSGGAVAIGHPIGASGARVLVTLIHGMQRLQAKKGVTTLCIGGGMGIALALERE